MRINKKSQPTLGENLVYITNQLCSLCQSRNIRRNSIMVLFNQSNPSTAKRWLEGNDLYLFSLVKIINHYGMDLLQFFEYKGHRFRTTLDELARAEQAGINIGSLLEGHELKLPKEFPVPAQPVVEQPNEFEHRLVETQQELIDTQKQIIIQLRRELEAAKRENQQAPVKMFADSSLSPDFGKDKV